MAKLPPDTCPTLVAADAALEASQPVRRARRIGMGEIGGPCERAIWYSFRWATEQKFTAKTLKIFDGGHKSEALTASRIRLVAGIELWTIDPDTGKQYAVTDPTGHMAGRIDGVVLGLLQAPKTPHVWDHKCSEKMSDLEKMITKVSEKRSLQAWSETYYGQAQCYMHYLQLTRHWLTCSKPGDREWIAVRTEYDMTAAVRYEARAKRVVEAQEPPMRIATKSDYYICKMCDHRSVCWNETIPKRHCRSCIHAMAVEGGQWICGIGIETPLSIERQQLGCNAHLYLPGLIDGRQIDADPDYKWIEYAFEDGSIWKDEGPV